MIPGMKCILCIHSEAQVEGHTYVPDALDRKDLVDAETGVRKFIVVST